MTTRRPGSDPRPAAESEGPAGAFSALKTPVGPKSRSVYVRRRLIVLLGIVAVIAAIALMIIRPGSSSRDTGEVQKVEVPSDLAEKPETPVEGEETATPTCEPHQLTVTAVTDQGSYGPGEIPELSLTVENSGTEECVADLGTAGMTFTVTSGADEVWRSTDCQSARDNLPVKLAAGETLETESISWDRTRSSNETCEITRDPVSADGASYHLSVSAAGVKSDTTAQFLLY